MNGHQPLIAMRLKGRVPEFGIEVETDAECSTWPAQWHGIHEQFGVIPPKAFVSIGPGDTLASLDLRFAVGLEVKVEGMLSRRVRDVFAAFRAAGAKRVIGVVFMPRGQGLAETLEIFDSEGEVSWRKS